MSNTVLSDEEIERAAGCTKPNANVVRIARLIERAVIEKLGAGEVVPVAWDCAGALVRTENTMRSYQNDGVTSLPLYDATALAQRYQQGYDAGYEAERAELQAALVMIAKCRETEVEAKLLADEDGRYLNAQGHQQAINAIDFCTTLLADRQSTQQEP